MSVSVSVSVSVRVRVSVSVSVSVDGGQTGARQGPDGTTGPRDLTGTSNGVFHTPRILDLGTHDLIQAWDEARGQTGARRETGHATDSGSWDP